jgi:hypothetical protein
MVKLEDLRSLSAEDVVRRPQITDTYPYYMVLHEVTATELVNWTVQAINLMYERGWRVVSTSEHYGVGLAKNSLVFYVTLERKARGTGPLPQASAQQQPQPKPKGSTSRLLKKLEE